VHTIALGGYYHFLMLINSVKNGRHGKHVIEILYLLSGHGDVHVYIALSLFGANYIISKKWQCDKHVTEILFSKKCQP
jgi:hypothetical protein